MISEFYKLRRTAIKDIASYLAFLAGFIGAAPFAWGLLASQLETGSFVTGLWYFFAIVIAAGIFAGVIGLGLGTAAGLIWELFHRSRRRNRLLHSAFLETVSEVSDMAPRPVKREDQPPRLQLVTPTVAPLPDLAGHRLVSIRFFENTAELEFGTLRIGVGAGTMVSSGSVRARYPDSGSHSALCSLIGVRVARLRTIAGDKVEISYENGSELTVARSSLLVA